MSDDQNAPTSRQPWSYQRIRSRLSTLIKVMPLAGGDEHTRKFLENMREDLIEIRAGLDQWHGEGIFHERK